MKYELVMGICIAAMFIVVALIGFWLGESLARLECMASLIELANFMEENKGVLQ